MKKEINGGNEQDRSVAQRNLNLKKSAQATHKTR